MKSLKLVNISIVSSLILINSMLYSCNNPIENINKNNINVLDNNKIAFISASDKKGSSIKFNINSIIKNFSTKATQNGSQEVTTMNSIRIVLSENSIDPFNFPVNLNTSKLYTTPPGIPTSVVFDNLQAGKTYYIAARAYSSSVESTANNITEGGTYITNEYIQVSPSGLVSIASDLAPIGEINFNIPLKNAVGARVDVPISISNGKMGDFKNKDNNVEQVASIPLSIPDVDITDGGNGAIVWKENTSTPFIIKKIKLKTIIDNIPNGSSIEIDTTPANSDDVNKPSISLNSNNNGFVCWDYKVTNSVIRFKHINNLTTLSGVNNLSGLNQSGCDIQIKNNSSDSGIIAFTDINAGGVIKARALKSSNNFASFTFANDISPSDIIVSSNASNSNVSLSKVTKDNYAMAIWQRSSGVSRQINSNKIKIDNTGVNPNLIVITGDEALLEGNNSSINLTNPSISIDENGNGFAVWQKALNIICSKIVNFNPEGALINITTSSNASNPKVYINDQGHGLITWTQAQDIYGLNIINYEISTTQFKINDLTGSDIQDKSSFDFDSNGNGYIGWEDDRDSPSTSEIYGKRIIDYYPN